MRIAFSSFEDPHLALAPDKLGSLGTDHLFIDLRLMPQDAEPIKRDPQLARMT